MSLLTVASIPSGRAEAGLNRINEVLAEFRLSWPTVSPSSATGQNIARDAFLRLVTIAEMFAGEHLLDVTEQRLPDDDLVIRIWEERTSRLRDWNSKKEAWKDLHRVQWYPQWKELKGLTTGRNIIAHGMGELTRSQLRKGQLKPGVKTDLAAAKLKLKGYTLALDDADIERCGKRVRHFIEWLDAQFVP
jgi:hypothetical protein